MYKFKKGDIVGRLSYNKDVIFEIIKIIKVRNGNHIYILKGLTKRIEADSLEDDLEKLDKRFVFDKMKEFDEEIYNHIQLCLNNSKYYIHSMKKVFNNKRGENGNFMGKILHLDGDKRYAEKSMKYYKSIGLNAIVKNVPENKQQYIVCDLIDKYRPDVIVLTGHDGMIKRGTAYNDIYNYRNSIYFMNTVNEIRKNFYGKDISIFAGACQSYYEGIMLAGANFASSPARIMIDFIDPLIVAERIATTDNTQYLTIREIKDELRDGERGISGIGSTGKKRVIVD